VEGARKVRVHTWFEFFARGRVHLSIVLTNPWREALLCKGCKTKGKGKGKWKGKVQAKEKVKESARKEGQGIIKRRRAHQGKGCLTSKG
jgi:hypothetical protein